MHRPVRAGGVDHSDHVVDEQREYIPAASSRSLGLPGAADVVADDME
jgi:hypothetical protein